MKIPLPARVPAFVKWLYPSWFVWDLPTTEKVLYLTFDDGPIPEVTHWVLEQLARYQAKATFFCIGENIAQHPDVFRTLLQHGHAVGNHTYHHLSGWEVNLQKYLDNTVLAQQTMEAIGGTRFRESAPKKLFRPPYGTIKRKQAKALHRLEYEIIMYRTVAFDWESDKSGESCYQNIIQNAKRGDLIVFHDSLKAFSKLQYALPKVLAYYTERGYQFKRIPA